MTMGDQLLDRIQGGFHDLQRSRFTGNDQGLQDELRIVGTEAARAIEEGSVGGFGGVLVDAIGLVRGSFGGERRKLIDDGLAILDEFRVFPPCRILDDLFEGGVEDASKARRGSGRGRGIRRHSQARKEGASSRLISTDPLSPSPSPEAAASSGTNVSLYVRKNLCLS